MLKPPAVLKAVNESKYLINYGAQITLRSDRQWYISVKMFVSNQSQTPLKTTNLPLGIIGIQVSKGSLF